MATTYDKASLVLIPSGTKEGTIFSQKPTNGDGDFTFSRSTSATRVGPSGLIEKETQNLLLQSNQFDTTWINSNTTETGGQSGYDGSSDAWLLSKSAANGMIYQSVSSSGIQTISVYAKQGTKNWMQIYAVGSLNVRAYYDLANGVLGAYSLNTIDRKIESVGNGWYRCSVTFDSSLTIIRLYVSDGNNDDSGTSGNIYIQDAQLEQGLVARDYIETTTSAVYGGITDNIPRLDYNGSCPSLLLEPQRTNLVPNGDYIEDLNSRPGSIVTTNYGISPEGYQNSTRVQKGTSLDGYQYLSYLLSPSTTYTMSIYAKGSGAIRFNLYDGTSAQESSWINLTSEWVRYTFTATSNSTTRNGDFGFKINNDAEVYGFQQEEGSYATSYIPTYGTSVTRVADDFDSTLNTTNIFNTNEGTLYLETKTALFTNESANTNFIGFTETSSGNYFRFRGQSGYLYAQAVGWSATPVLSNDSSYRKYLFKWNASETKFYVNGTLLQTTTPTATFNPNEFRFGAFDTKTESTKILIFPTALTDSECIALTTL